MDLFTVIAGVIGGAIVLLVLLERRRVRQQVWWQAAERVGLTGVEEAAPFGGRAYLTGHAGELHVRLEEYHRSKYETGTSILVTGLGHGSGGLSLRREGLGTAIEKRFIVEREIEVGEASFDEEYYVQGQAPLALAILDPETRRRLAALLRNRIDVGTGSWVDVDASLSDGVLEVKVKDAGLMGTQVRIPEILAKVLEVGRRLVAPDDLAGRIAENLRAESSVGARVQSLRVLAREFPRHPATREALLAGCQDPSPDVRLCAATALGEDGRGTLLALVEDSGTEDSCAARAISALRSRLPAGPAEAALRRALAGAGRPETAQACLETLGFMRRAGAEGLMLEALRSEDGRVSAAAARALGRAGTVAAVPALREAAEAGGDMRRAARQAIAEIQARLTGAEPGQLTLAGGEAGALSLAGEAAEPGRHSLAGASGEGVQENPEEQEEPAAPTPRRGRVLD